MVFSILCCLISHFFAVMRFFVFHLSVFYDECSAVCSLPVVLTERAAQTHADALAQPPL
jgi:hypothetical protein